MCHATLLFLSKFLILCLFLLLPSLSAYLAEITKDSKYKDASALSAKWIEAHNIAPNKILLDSQSASDCSRSPASWIFTYNTGKFVEGLSVLYDVTADDSWNQL